MYRDYLLALRENRSIRLDRKIETASLENRREEGRGEASRSSEMALSFGALSKVDLSYADLERVALETRTNATLARFRRSMMEDIVEAYSRVFDQR